jgi:ribosomal protein S27AE
MNNDKCDQELLMESYETVITEAQKKCIRCGTLMTKHSDAEKAKKGYKNCPKCDLTFSPEATVKGSYAMRDGDSGKIKTGIHKEEKSILDKCDQELLTEAYNQMHIKKG